MRLRNIQLSSELWSRATDHKILNTTGVACSLALAAFIGAALPSADPFNDNVALLDGLIAAVLLALVWCGFRLIRPKHHDQVWGAIEAVGIPVTWALLMTALAFWFAHLYSDSDIYYKKVRSPVAASAGRSDFWKNTV